MARTNKSAPKMVVVDGVRYRPEDAPEKRSQVQHKMRTPGKPDKSDKDSK